MLDALQIEAQLVFPTFALAHFSRSKDPDVLYGGTGALNRAMTAFCALTSGSRPWATCRSTIPSGRCLPWRRRSRRAWPRSGSPPIARTFAHPCRPGTGLVLPGRGRRALRASRRGRQAPPEVVPQQRPAPAPRTGSAAVRTCGPRTSPCSTARRALPRLHGPRRRLSSGTPGLRGGGHGARGELGAGPPAQRRPRPALVLQVRTRPPGS